MRTSLSVLCFAVVLSFTAVSSFAQESAAPPPGQRMAEKLAERFKTADTNGDGQLSKDEMTKGMPHLASKFDEIDANHDGEVTSEELKAYLQSRRTSRNAQPAPGQ